MFDQSNVWYQKLILSPRWVPPYSPRGHAHLLASHSKLNDTFKPQSHQINLLSLSFNLKYTYMKKKKRQCTSLNLVVIICSCMTISLLTHTVTGQAEGPFSQFKFTRTLQSHVKGPFDISQIRMYSGRLIYRHALAKMT